MRVVSIFFVITYRERNAHFFLGHFSSIETQKSPLLDCPVIQHLLSLKFDDHAIEQCFDDGLVIIGHL